MDKYNYVCKHCNTDNVRIEAWVIWDKEEQEFDIAEVLNEGYNYCVDCDSDTKLIQIPLNKESK